MNIEDFVTYKQAIVLKKLGFRENCSHFYDKSGILYEKDMIAYENEHINITSLTKPFNNSIAEDICDAPTLAQVQKWLFTCKKRYVYVVPNTDINNQFSWYISQKNHPCTWDRCGFLAFKSPEVVLSDGITKCLELLENE